MKKIIGASLMLVAFSLSSYGQKEHLEKNATKAGETAPETMLADGFARTSSGLEYKIVSRGAGTQKAQIGSYVELNVHIYVHDSLIFDSRKMNNNLPVPIQVMHPAFNGDPAEGFPKMAAGDSAIFRLPVDSLKKTGQPLPPYMHPGDMMMYQIKMVSVKSAAEMKKDAEEKAVKQKDVDDKLIGDYLKQNNVTATRSASGLYYKIQKEGTGMTAKVGDKVSVNYTGRTLNGTVFDSNVDSNFHHMEPFTFSLGHHQVIKGWDEGVALLKKGGKVTLYIPSTLAYGAQSPTAAIPSNSILIFDIEVTDIKSDITKK
ncbi:MAG TPA: FKBP-type peptidyl-prolyl cis-trans isomerase [Flavipsychrobacter sp.]|nr:FKBP-type peptidyl-prolyl cis-trans isomerase [Flavipsychrobacter sp.]